MRMDRVYARCVQLLVPGAQDQHYQNAQVVLMVTFYREVPVPLGAYLVCIFYRVHA